MIDRAALGRDLPLWRLNDVDLTTVEHGAGFGLVISCTVGRPTAVSLAFTSSTLRTMKPKWLTVDPSEPPAGVTFEVPYREVAQLGLKLAFIVDPVGTRIELTEGLAGR